MLADILSKALLGSLPVLLFLSALVHFDAHKLVRLPIVLFTLAGGAAAAAAAYLINTYLIGVLNVEFTNYMRLGAPFIEEILKALIVVILIQTNRVGFAFDSAILGFAAGAGFALAENFYYLHAAGGGHIAVWVIRGFGAAIMHGGATAIFAMMGHVITLKNPALGVLGYLPGLALAIALHSAFNFFLKFPVSSTVVMMLALPAIMTVILRRDQKSIHDWLQVDFAEHKKLLEHIRSGEYEHSGAGRFLAKLRDRFDKGVVDKMVYYIELHTELVLTAEEVLQARENDEKILISTETREKLLRLHALEKEIGKTGLLALRPHLHFNRHELWELYMLEKEAGFKHPHAH